MKHAPTLSPAGPCLAPDTAGALPVSPSPSRLISLALGLVLATPFAAAGLSGCSGVKFTRQSGGVRYRALPVGTVVRVTDRVMELPQPTVFIGTLAVTLKGDIAPDQAAAESVFVKHAARYGCDAVVGPRVETRTKTLRKKKRQVGPKGEARWVETETMLFFHDWTARCVRTSAAPGGIAAAAASDEGQAPALSPDALPGAPGGVTLEPAPKPKRRADPVADRVWARLAAYKGGYLRSWAQALNGPAPAASEVLDCLNELMVQVSGPGGFWRRTVPREWFGCDNDPGTAQCQRLKKAGRELAPYDRLQSTIARLRPSSAREFLRRSEKRIMDYLDDYVPARPNLSGMQQTPFYKRRLQPESGDP